MLEELNKFITSLDNETILYSKILLTVLATAALSFASKYLLRKAEEKCSKSKNLWDDTVLYSVRKPIRFFIWIYGITLACSIAFKELDIEIVDLVDKIRNVSFIAFFAWAILRLISKVEDKFKTSPRLRKKLDETTLDAISKLLKITVVITTTLIILQSLGFSISAVLAFGGVGGLAVGLAAKDLLSNFFGAFVIYIDKPFKVGDWIKSPDKEIEGTVEKIGWRQTVIRTFDQRPLYVPNSLFNNIIVENPSRMFNRRIYEHFGVRYRDIENVQKIVSEVEEMLKTHDEIDTTKTLMVNLNRFSDSSVDFFIYTFTKTTNWEKFHQIKQDVMLKISDIVVANKSSFAFPTRTLHIPNEVKYLAANNDESN
jgi:MscS family membrane protein